MRIAAGILSLVGGLIFPMGMLVWLNRRLSREPALGPQRVGLVLALNGVLPVGLIGLGVGLLSTDLWESGELRIVLVAAWLATAVLLLLLAVTAWRTRRGGSHG